MTTTADTILAIDLGRFKSVAFVYSLVPVSMFEWLHR